MLIDTHAHLNFRVFKEDTDEVIRRSLEGGIWMINVGTQYDTSKKAVEIAENYQEGVYAAIGLHPIHSEEDFSYEKYKELAKSPKVVAIGEIGLDYKSEYVLFKEKQKEVFLKQLDLARELNLPVIFHCRFAHEDLIEILNYKLKTINYKLKGVIHCFAGTWEQAQKYLEMGFYLGFNGIIFKLDLDEIIKKTPLDRILVETDCPYLTPPQVEGRNEPLYVKYVAERIAKIKNRASARSEGRNESEALIEHVSFEEVAKTTTENAKKLFNI